MCDFGFVRVELISRFRQEISPAVFTDDGQCGGAELDQIRDVDVLPACELPTNKRFNL